MSDLDLYNDNTNFSSGSSEPQSQNPGSPTMGILIRGIIKRWYVVLPLFIILAGILLPAVWFLVPSTYIVHGTIHVAPILENIVTGEQDSGEISNYSSFVNTQCQIITGTQVTQRVADDLNGKNLKFFTEAGSDPLSQVIHKVTGRTPSKDPFKILTGAVSSEKIQAHFIKNTELVEVTIDTDNVEEGTQIVDAYLRNYMAYEGSNSTERESRQLTALEDQKDILERRRLDLSAKIRTLAEEYGSKNEETLTNMQQIKLQRVGMLLTQVTEYEARRISLEAKIDVLKQRINSLKESELQVDEQGSEASDLLINKNDPKRKAYIDSDPTISAISANLTSLNQEMLVISQRLKPNHPDILFKKQVIENMEKTLEEKREEIGKAYDEYSSEQLKNTSQTELAVSEKAMLDLNSELSQVKTYEERFRALLAKEDSETVKVGRDQLDIQDLQDELTLVRETYRQILNRIQDIEMERKRPARISVQSRAVLQGGSKKKLKMLGMAGAGSFALPLALAFLLARLDKRMMATEQLSKHIDVRILGTTTNFNSVERKLLPSRIAEDFQAIRANMRLMAGDSEPKVIAVSSPTPGDGKTSLAINLAISAAKAGRKVLLIDGDLRKPDVAYSLNMSLEINGLQQAMVSDDYHKFIVNYSNSNLDILSSVRNNFVDVCEVIASKAMRKLMDRVRSDYDQIIIDTPPVLAFPDALIWGKLSDGVMLASFMNKTQTKDIYEVKKKFSEVGVNVIGDVINNVTINQSAYGYGYKYGYAYSEKAINKRPKRKDTFLLEANVDDLS